MSQDTGSRRLPRPVPPRPQAIGAADAALPTLMSVLARAERLTDVLPQLHQHALDVTGGTCALLFEHNPRNAVMQATSGFGLEELRTDPWTPEPPEADLVNAAFRRKTATFVSNLDHQMPELAQRLHATSALVLPLARGKERVGLLAIGFADAPDAAALRGDSVEIADTFLTALELFRLRQNEQLQSDLRDLLEQFSASLSATLNVASGLDLFCDGSDRLFGADRTSVYAV